MSTAIFQNRDKLDTPNNNNLFDMFRLLSERLRAGGPKEVYACPLLIARWIAASVRADERLEAKSNNRINIISIFVITHYFLTPLTCLKKTVL